VELNDGSLFWGRGMDRDKNPIRDNGPSNGRCGEALFFATLYDKTREASYRRVAERTMKGLRSTLSDAEDCARLIDRLWYGVIGVGGILYATIRVANLLDDDDLRDCARALSTHITEPYICQDGVYDIQKGTSGLLLGLLALYEAGYDSALNRACVCADHLLDEREPDPETGNRAWLVNKPRPTTGFAHGGSGIAHALLRLYEHTGESRLYDAAIEVFDFERDLYVPKIRNWVDDREQSLDEPILCSWCHGSPGIGLARLTILDYVRDEDESGIALDLKRAIESSLLHDVAAVDNLCCGRLGRWDFLQQASRALNNRSLARKVWNRLDEWMDTVEDTGFELPSVAERKHAEEGFWKSHAGVGYFLVQMAYPETVPSVLTLSTGMSRESPPNPRLRQSA
jgi:lantibiotic modifying enzyme